MLSNSTILHDRQFAVRRELDRRNISLKVVSFDSGIPYSTLLSYFPGERDKVPAGITGSAIFALCDALPADLLSLLLPDGFQIVRASEAIDHDTFAAHCLQYASAHSAARHHDSPGGVEIVASEADGLNSKAAQLSSCGDGSNG